MSKTHNRWHNVWTEDEDCRLILYVWAKMPRQQIALEMNRTENAVVNRVKTLRRTGELPPYSWRTPEQRNALPPYAPVRRKLPVCDRWDFTKENEENVRF